MARSELGINDTSGTIDTIDTIDTTLDQSEERARPIRGGQKLSEIKVLRLAPEGGIRRRRTSGIE